MAMDPNQRDPEITYRDPLAYIAYLRTKRLNPMQIDELMRQRFGPGTTPEERAKQEASAQQKGALAQTGGAIGGLLLGREALGGFQNIGGLFGGGTTGATTGAGTAGAGVTGAGVAGTGAVAQPTLLGGANALGGGTAATTGTGSTLGSIGSVALPVAAAVAAISNAWETGMKDILRGRGTRADYANQAVNMLTGGLPNIALRLLGKRSIGAMMVSGKSLPQSLRDDFRKDLRQAGVATKLDGSDHVTLADGSKFNIGLDGKTKYKNVGENIDKKTSRNAWDVDFSNPLAKYATDQIDPMIRNIYGADDPKKKFFPGQYTGMLVNAVTSNAKNEKDVLANIQAVLGKSKFAQQAGVGVTPPPPPRPGKGEVVRVSPGMYMNDKGHINPAKTVKEALASNYKKDK